MPPKYQCRNTFPSLQLGCTYNGLAKKTKSKMTKSAGVKRKAAVSVVISPAKRLKRSVAAGAKRSNPFRTTSSGKRVKK